MIYKQFQDMRLSTLGFGTMRLPIVPGGSAADIDDALLERMVDYAIAQGVNYFDTAVHYHNRRAEEAIGRALSRHPRDSWYIADKYPGYQVLKGTEFPLRETFAQSLQSCGVDYFDFYLLHNVNESALDFYMSDDVGCVAYFVEQRKLGRIRHLGFSCHGSPAILQAFLDKYGDVMEFCQIQLNYLDWTLQDAEKKVRLLNERGIPIWVMEPVRGGRLAALDENTEARMLRSRPGASVSSWAFRWLQTVPKPQMVLSGMSNMEQLADNINTFSAESPLSNEEIALLYTAADAMVKLTPCTGCKYCCAGCPKGIDIPLIISLYNDYRFHNSTIIRIRYSAMGQNNASTCIGCGKCARICPQGIDVPSVMREFAAAMATGKSWEEICNDRVHSSGKA